MMFFRKPESFNSNRNFNVTKTKHFQIGESIKNTLLLILYIFQTISESKIMALADPRFANSTTASYLMRTVNIEPPSKRLMPGLPTMPFFLLTFFQRKNDLLKSIETKIAVIYRQTLSLSGETVDCKKKGDVLVAIPG